MPTALKRPATNVAASDRNANAYSNNNSNEPKVDLQPLRDLAKNFDLDIEPYLEEYLRVTEEEDDDDLLEHNHGGGGNGGRMGGDNNNNNNNNDKQRNFAAAALKIQNSVGIYNRKVDFLHQVVYQVFHDFISSINNHNNNNNNKRSSNTKGGGDAEIEKFNEFDPDLEFLLLDDVLPVDGSAGRTKINLKVINSGGNGNNNGNNGDSEVNATGVNLDTTTLNRTSNGNGNDNPNNLSKTGPEVTLLSLGGVMSATRITDQNGTFVINRSSLDMASPSAMSRMLMANLQGGANGGGGGGGGAGGNANGVGEGSLRLLAGMCDVGSDGALLMPGTRASVFVNGENAAIKSAEDVQVFPGGLSPGPRTGGGNMDGSNDFGAAVGIMEEDDNHNASFGNNDGDDWRGDNDHDGDTDGVGFQLNDDMPMDGLSGDVDEEEQKQEEDMNADPPSKPKVIEDPWATLDLHEPSENDRAQPLRIGVTTRLPQGLDEEDRPSAMVTGSRTRIKKGPKKNKKKKNSMSAAERAMNDFLEPPFLADITVDEAMRDDNDDDTVDDEDESSDEKDTSFRQGTRRHLRLLDKLKKRELIFGEEFAYVAKAHAKHRDSIRKQRRLELRQEKAKKKKESGETNNLIMDFDDNDYGGGFAFGGDDDNDSFGNPDFGNPNDGNEALHRSNVDFNVIDGVFGGSRGGEAFDDNDYNDNDGFANDGAQQTFEELCRAHLRKFAKSAEAYAAETQLTKRVSNWQDGLAPLLEEQEKRPEFDIHGYSRRILQNVERKIKVRKRTSTGEKKLESSSSGGGGQSNNNNVVDFSAVFGSDCEDYEVCRLFLSTLMLCNRGNVKVHNNEGAGGEEDNVVHSLESLNIELLNSTFQQPMESFMAPSAEDVQEKENIASSSLHMVDENESMFDE